MYLHHSRTSSRSDRRSLHVGLLTNVRTRRSIRAPADTRRFPQIGEVFAREFDYRRMAVHLGCRCTCTPTRDACAFRIVVRSIFSLYLIVMCSRRLRCLHHRHRSRSSCLARSVAGVARIPAKVAQLRWAIRSIVSCMERPFANYGGSTRPLGEGRHGASNRVDLGGSHVMATVVDETGETKAKHERDITDHSHAAYSRGRKVSAKPWPTPRKERRRIGIGAPGNIDLETGTIRYSPNFGWKDVALRRSLRGTFKFRSSSATTRAARRSASITYGPARAYRISCCSPGHRDRRRDRFRRPATRRRPGQCGEIGHHRFDRTTASSAAARRSAALSAVFGNRLIRHALALAPSFPRSTLLDVPKTNSARKRFAAPRKPATARPRAWRNWIDDLGYGLANIVAFVNPSMIALGGGVASAGAFITDQVGPLVEARSTMVPPGSTQIVTAALGTMPRNRAATMALRGGMTA